MSEITNNNNNSKPVRNTNGKVFTPRGDTTVKKVGDTNNTPTNQGTDNNASVDSRKRFNRFSGGAKSGGKPHHPKRNTKDWKSAPKVEFEVLDRRKVSRTMAGGRRMRFTVLVVSKIARGVIGIGYGKSKEAIEALHTAVRRSQNKQNTFKVHMYDGRTFSHGAIGKFGATELQILPSAKEKGLKALGIARKLAKMAGIMDGVVRILTKAKSKYNICNAFRHACSLLTPNVVVTKYLKGEEYKAEVQNE